MRVTFVEMFWDLIFAVVLSRFAYNIAYGWPEGKWLNFVEMLMLLSLWYENAFFTSVVYSLEGLSQVFVFLQLIGVLGMGFFRLVVTSGGGSVLTGFVVSFLWARFFQIVLYVCLAFSRNPTKTRVAAFVYGFWLAVTCIPVAVTLGLANDVSVYGRVMIWIITFGLHLLVAFLLPLLPFWRQALPLGDLRHFRDRFGSFLVFLFAFLLFALFFDETGPYTAGEWGSIALFFVIGFSFMWLYYNDRVDDERVNCIHPLQRSPILGQLWAACHLPLAMALIIMADASVQFIYYYRGIIRLPNTVVPGIGAGNTPVVVLSNSVQWIYGVSFAVALLMISVIGILYEYHTRRSSKGRLLRTIGRLALAVVMVLIPLGGLNGPMTPIIQPIVGAVGLVILVLADWAFSVALGPLLPDAETRVVQIETGPQVLELQTRVQQQDQEIAVLRRQLLEAQAAPRAAVVSPRGAAPAGAGGDGSSELSSSKDWGFSSRSSSVVEDVVASEEASAESHVSDEERVEQAFQSSKESSGSEKRDAPAAASSSEDTP
jgi:hypothetical protein